MPSCQRLGRRWEVGVGLGELLDALTAEAELRRRRKTLKWAIRQTESYRWLEGVIKDAVWYRSCADQVRSREDASTPARKAGATECDNEAARCQAIFEWVTETPMPNSVAEYKARYHEKELARLLPTEEMAEASNSTNHTRSLGGKALRATREGCCRSPLPLSCNRQSFDAGSTCGDGRV